MNLLSEVQQSADEYVSTQINIAQNLEILSTSSNIDVAQLNESVTQFLTNYARKAANGDLSGSVKENAINIFAAISALTQPDIQAAFRFDDPKTPSLGKILDDYYGKNGQEAHSAAEGIINNIGKHPSVATFRKQAEVAVNDPTRITEYAGKIRTKIEPVMNRLLSQERERASVQQQADVEQKKAETMGRPMQGAVPQRS